MRKLSYVFIVLFLGGSLIAQDVLQAQKEVLGRIEIGSGNEMIQYHSYEDGFYSPNGPMVDREGRLLFYPSTTRDNLLVWSNNKWSYQALFKVMADWSGSSYTFNSQAGFVMLGDVAIIPLQNGRDSFFYPGQGTGNIPPSYDVISYTMPFGTVTVSTRPPFTYSTELISNKNVKVRDLEETRAWLPTQPGGFTIGDDGLLYRNGMIWSAILPKGYDGSKYLGKLASGHNIWGSGDYGMESWFALSNSKGEIELEISFPWALEEKFEDKQFHNYGVGPYGEFYCLITPKLVPGLRWPKGSQSELVVVRNHMKYFGRLNDGGVRLRKEPNTTSDILGTYPNKTGFRILETGTKEETIGGQKNVWYKVRLLDGTEGWFFGAFVHNLYDGPNGNPPPWPNVPDW